ncbi:MAG: phosphoenolpyruvate carboxykinase (GTP) [Candidatus Lokiarchaeota archaeon]|nr:phosphoenolpyruvate carboxykinase (GTP) [Candidatus Lokiarchaeota archaeon]
MSYKETFSKFVDSVLISQKDVEKLYALQNEYVLKIVKKFVDLCKPSKVTVISDSKEDIEYVKQKSVSNQEESTLRTEGHTIHYDSYYDQARDKENTEVLIPKGEYRSPWINTMDRDEGLEEILDIMDGCMKDKECLVRFYCLGPLNSKFTIGALQLTDSFYVAHSEDLLYRKGYEEFKELNGSNDFFYFIHSAGELVGNPPVTKNIDKRRIYVDLQEGRVLTVNNQYAGNSLGLKKLALRLAIHKANNEDWLTEHYFILGVRPKGKNRVTYFTGAFPSACGKTSTAMLPGQLIVGDDIAYLRSWEDGFPHAVNIEKGIFGIIKDVNAKNDPVIYEALNTPRELIYSNVLVKDGKPYWIGMGVDHPKDGFNHYGNWIEGMTDDDGNKVTHAHPNGRYTLNLSDLSNCDPKLDDPNGVPVHGIFYGGRDSETMPPIVESINWEHGIFSGAIIESETTSATLGAVGVRKASPMANLDFLVVPLGKYLKNHQKFGHQLKHCPQVFSTNYFLKGKDGKYLNAILDKKVWVMWAEGRTKGDYDAIKTPIGYLPRYKDLKNLFMLELNKDYSQEDYIKQFTLRVNFLLNKLNRMEEMYKTEKEIPKFFWDILFEQRSALKDLQKKFGKEEITPSELTQI